MGQWVKTISTKLTFGKYKGVEWKHVPSSYRKWAIKEKAVIIKGELMADLIIKIATKRIYRNKKLIDFF